MHVDMLHGSNIRVLFNIAILQGGLFFYYKKKHERRERPVISGDLLNFLFIKES